MTGNLTHVDAEGHARMVNVGDKAESERVAVARGCITLAPRTLDLVEDGLVAKGDVLTVAQIAGIQAAKRTHELIPMCHPLLLTHVEVRLESRRGDQEACIDVEATVRTTGRTGVEMEALVAVSVAALTVYDMCKAADRSMTITGVRLIHKEGGRSGTWDRDEA